MCTKWVKYKIQRENIKYLKEFYTINYSVKKTNIRYTMQIKCTEYKWKLFDININSINTHEDIIKYKWKL